MLFNGHGGDFGIAKVGQDLFSFSGSFFLSLEAQVPAGEEKDPPWVPVSNDIDVIRGSTYHKDAFVRHRSTQAARTAALAARKRGRS